jgi:hypothetical protein
VQGIGQLCATGAREVDLGASEDKESGNQSRGRPQKAMACPTQPGIFSQNVEPPVVSYWRALGRAAGRLWRRSPKLPLLPGGPEKLTWGAAEDRRNRLSYSGAMRGEVTAECQVFDLQ